MENKKTLVLSIIGVLVLVIAVVGVSFAMYSFSATGTKENVIRTGSVSIDYKPGTDGLGTANTKIQLTNQYPISDASGSQLTGTSQLDFAVSAEMSGAMTINYELALSDISEGATLTDDYVKFNIAKEGSYILETAADKGITVASRADDKGTLIPEGYLLDSGSFTQTGTVDYTIRAWVSDAYDLPNQNVTTEGTTQSNQTTSETFSFKVKVVAQQA